MRGKHSVGVARSTEPEYTIVVAGDEAQSRSAVTEALSDPQLSVEAYASGAEVVERVRRGGVDLVLLDLMMPEMSGIEACRLIKSASQAFLPVLIVTGRADSACRIETLNLGADDHIVKPFDGRELMARVHAMLRIKHSHDLVSARAARLVELSAHDPLTGAYDARYLASRLRQEFKRAERYREPLGLLLLDVDGMQRVNATVGQAEGDVALKLLVERVRGSVREGDIVARRGLDEFAVILPNTQWVGALAAAERVCRNVSQQAFFDGTPNLLWVTVSLGVALYPSRDVKTQEDLLGAVETALGQAKANGGNRIAVSRQLGQIYMPAARAMPVSPAAAQGPRAPGVRRSQTPAQRAAKPASRPPRRNGRE